MRYLYHGSRKKGIKFLRPKKISRMKRQRNPRIYAVNTIQEAAIFACPFFDSNSRIYWKKGKMHLKLKSKKLGKKYKVSVYAVDKKLFTSVHRSELEWYSPRAIKPVKEFIINDALKYAKRKGIDITIEK